MNILICIKRSHFDFHQKWGLVIFHGDDDIKATSPPGVWVKFLNFDPWY